MFIPLHDGNALINIRRQYVTLTIIAINVLIWVFLGTPAISNPEAARAASLSFGFIPSVVNHIKTLPLEYGMLPSWASYVTYSFLHADFMHLAGNMLFLWVFADNVEDAMGHVRFVIFYVVCAAAGAWMHALVLPMSDSPLIGASGAAAGVIGAYLMLHPHVRVWVLALGRIPLRLKAMWVLGGWIAFQLGMMAFSNGSQVSWSAHVGGAAAGIILIVFMRKSGVTLFDRNDAKAAPVTIETKRPVIKREKTRWGR
jgi:membrane associated rhomboid family serine protease